MKKGYIRDTLTSVDIQEIIKLEEKWLKFTKVLFIEKTLKYLFLEKFLEQLFA